MKKPGNPFLKKASGPKPPNRREMKHGLGKGLGSLMGTPAAVATPVDPAPSASVPPKVTPPVATKVLAPTGETVLEVPILEIERSPYQPRREFAEPELEELAASIRANGVIQPPTVRKNGAGRYELICGERRLRAAQRAGLTRIRITLVNVTDEQAAAMTATENLQREDLNPIEEGESYRMLMDRFSYTQEQVAEKVGKSRPVVANATRLLELPDEVKDLIVKHLISTGHAKVLLSVDDEKDRVLLARACVNDGLTVRALEAKIAKRNQPPVEKKQPNFDLDEAYVKNLVNELHIALGCAVRIRPSATLPTGRRVKGLLEIDFADNDDLDRILNVVGVKLD